MFWAQHASADSTGALIDQARVRQIVTKSKKLVAQQPKDKTIVCDPIGYGEERIVFCRFGDRKDSRNRLARNDAPAHREDPA